MIDEEEVEEGWDVGGDEGDGVEEGVEEGGNNGSFELRVVENIDLAGGGGDQLGGPPPAQAGRMCKHNHSFYIYFSLLRRSPDNN